MIGADNEAVEWKGHALELRLWRLLSKRWHVRWKKEKENNREQGIKTAGKSPEEDGDDCHLLLYTTDCST
jgi:hypothetical protein